MIFIDSPRRLSQVTVRPVPEPFSADHFNSTAELGVATLALFRSPEVENKESTTGNR
jgi:hypothetical protein